MLYGPHMKILALDTALGACSVCVLDSGLVKPLAQESIVMARGHAEALMPMMDRVVSQIPGGFESLNRVAVSVGPGSFTGIRVGIAAARAIGIACNIPVVGVSTLSALAAPLVADKLPTTIVAAIDAHHGNIYYHAMAGNGRMIVPPRLTTVREAIRTCGSDPYRFTGSGAPLLAIEAWSIGLRAEAVGALVAPDIAYIGRLGLLSDPATARPTPYYLKAPDAKPQEKGRIARVP